MPLYEGSGAERWGNEKPPMFLSRESLLVGDWDNVKPDTEGNAPINLR